MFYADSPPLTRSDITERWAQWKSKEQVRSGAVAVGYVALLPRERDIIDSMRFRFTNFDADALDAAPELTGRQRLLLRSLRGGFERVITADGNRGVLPGKIAMYAGFFNGRDRDFGALWHGDVAYSRYLCSHGGTLPNGRLLPSTDFGVGLVSKNDVNPAGGALLRHITFGESGQLQVENHGQGAVSRLTVGDIHTATQLSGPRVMFIADYYPPS